MLVRLETQGFQGVLMILDMLSLSSYSTARKVCLWSRSSEEIYMAQRRSNGELFMEEVTQGELEQGRHL
jgi:hypothetical protein